MLFLAWLALVTSTQAKITYVSQDGVITIIRYAGPDGNLRIPSIIDGLSVVAIGSGAFEGLTNLTAVEISSTVTNIGRSAFEGCGFDQCRHPG
jgi:hypothetical protein